MKIRVVLVCGALTLAAACGDDDDQAEDSTAVSTTVFDIDSSSDEGGQPTVTTEAPPDDNSDNSDNTGADATAPETTISENGTAENSDADPAASETTIPDTTTTSTGGAASDGDQPTEESLVDYINESLEVLASNDPDVIHAWQMSDCDQSVEEVADGIDRLNATLEAVAEADITALYGESTADVIEFDAAAGTASAQLNYSGDVETLQLMTSEQEPNTFTYADGAWTYDAPVCISDF